MPLKSLKDKIASVAGGEVLGDTNVPNSDDNKLETKSSKKSDKKEITKGRRITKEKSKAKSKLKAKAKVETKRRPSMFNMKKEKTEEIEDSKDNEVSNVIEEEEEKAHSISAVRDAVEGYEDVLSILGVKEHLEIDVDFKSDELDYVEFTQTQPLGFDFDEVTHFISLTKYTMHNLEKALKQRERDIVKVASQVKRVEQKMIETNQAKEMERMIGGMTEEERLIEENMELKVTINELNRKLASGADNENIIKDLKSQVEVLMSENDMLKLGSSSNQGKHGRLPTGLPKSNELPGGLPAFEEEDAADLFEDMISEIGGLYDDE